MNLWTNLNNSFCWTDTKELNHRNMISISNGGIWKVRHQVHVVVLIQKQGWAADFSCFKVCVLCLCVVLSWHLILRRRSLLQLLMKAVCVEWERSARAYRRVGNIFIPYQPSLSHSDKSRLTFISFHFHL